jgi:hypothetical protein
MRGETAQPGVDSMTKRQRPAGMIGGLKPWSNLNIENAQGEHQWSVCTLRATPCVS